jgi:PAS domain S-box-containing protein
MLTGAAQPRGARWVVRNVPLFLGVAVAYAAGSQLALELLRASDLQSVFFIPAGITVAVLLRVPHRQWFAVLLAAAVSEFALDVRHGFPADMSAGFAVANVVEPFLGALLVERICRHPIDLARRRDVLAFVTGAVAIAPVVGGLLGALSDGVFGGEFWPTWWQWALGDALGVVVAGGAILVWGSSPDRRALGSIIGVLHLCGAAAATTMAMLVTDLPVTFVVAIGVVVAGVVFGTRAVAVSAFLITAIIAIALTLDSGPIMLGVADSTALVLIKAQLGLFTVAGFVVAAEAFEAQLATRRAADLEIEARYHSTFENAGVGMAQVRLDGSWLRVNNRLCEILGYSREELLATTSSAIFTPEDAESHRALTARLVAGGPDAFTVERQCVRRDGSLVWTSHATSVVRSPRQGEESLVVVVEDISARKEAEATLRAQEAKERLARERAELQAEMIEQLEAVHGREARARRLAELLVASIADYATVEAPSGRDPVLAIAHRDPALIEPLLRLRVDHRLQPDDEASLARAAAGQEQLISEVTREVFARFTDDPAALALYDRLGIRSHMAVPIALGGEVPGALLLGRSDPSLPGFTSDDLAFVRTVAHRAGVVLTAAWLREEEHRISVRLQRSLLPDRIVEHPDVSMAARYEAGSDLLEVGGDWYDVSERASGEMVFSVGDVVGHGIDAAARVGRLRAAFAAYTAYSDQPGRLLMDLDRFANGPGNAEFTTVCCAVLDTASGELRYASAGHPPPLVVSADGRIRWLENARSVPLCTVAVDDRPEAAELLRPGDLVVLYTDGLVERRGESISEGLRRLGDAVSSLRQRPVQEICEALVAPLVDRTNHDDAAVLLVRYEPVEPHRFHRVFPAQPGHLRRVRRSAAAWLVARGIGAPTYDDVLIGLGEACANAVEHAYVGSDGPPGEFEVEIVEATPGSLRVRIVDRGTWRTGTGTDAFRGRGTAMMRAVSSEFVSRTDAAGTVATLEIPVRADPRVGGGEHAVGVLTSPEGASRGSARRRR